MSPTIYAALVDSLFQNPAPMFAGAVTAAIAAVLTAVKTGDQFLWPCALLLIAIGAIRTLDMRKYSQRTSPLTADEAARWEVRYQIGAMLYAIALGIWCIVALLGSDDPVAHMICTSVTLGYMAAGAGRTYGRPWIFHLQILLACGSLSVALTLHGNFYYICLAFLNVLFFIGLKHITTSLQKIFVRALIARDFSTAFASGIDALFTPTTPTPAFRLGAVTDPYEMYMSDIFTVTANLAGIPAMSIPIGRVGGLPVGGQILARHFDEPRMFHVAAALEAALGSEAHA